MTNSNEVTIYHNPACGTSRNMLSLIHNAVIESTVIEYLVTPPSKIQLQKLIQDTGISICALLRHKSTSYYEELNLGDKKWTDDDLLNFMMSHPILINHPMVITSLGTKLFQPSESVLDILPISQLGDFIKGDGEVVVNQDEQHAKY